MINKIVKHLLTDLIIICTILALIYIPFWVGTITIPVFHSLTVKKCANHSYPFIWFFGFITTFLFGSLGFLLKMIFSALWNFVFKKVDNKINEKIELKNKKRMTYKNKKHLKGGLSI